MSVYNNTHIYSNFSLWILILLFSIYLFGTRIDWFNGIVWLSILIVKSSLMNQSKVSKRKYNILFIYTYTYIHPNSVFIVNYYWVYICTYTTQIHQNKARINAYVLQSDAVSKRSNCWFWQLTRNRARQNHAFGISTYKFEAFWIRKKGRIICFGIKTDKFAKCLNWK